MESRVRVEDLPKQLIKNPHEAICNWAENRFKKVGDAVFKVLALSPISLLAPKIPYEDTFINPNLSYMLLTPSGGAKSMIAQTFSKITYNSFDFESITPARLQSELRGKSNVVSLIIGDMARILKDANLIKVLEGVLGEGRVSRMTRDRDERYDVNAIAYMAGVPSDITAYLSAGLLFRTNVMVMMHPVEVQKEIGQDIVSSIGSRSSDTNIETISKYYKLLEQNSLGLYPHKDKQIKGYKFDNLFKDVIYKEWAGLLDRFGTKKSTNWYRELVAGFKYLCCSAILNSFNRDIDKGTIYPNKQDLQLAIHLMVNEIRTKNHLINCEAFAKNIRRIEEVEAIAHDARDPAREYTIDMLREMLKGRTK